jgi:Putative beta-barrel porin 2
LAFTVRRSPFGVWRCWQFGGYIFCHLTCLAIAQEKNPLAQTAPVNNSPSSDNSKISSNDPAELSGTDQLAQIPSPPSGIAVSPGTSKISASDLGGPSGMYPLAQLTSAPSGIAISPAESKISTNDLSGSSGMNPLTSPGSSIGGEPGLSTQALPASREAADKKWLLLFNFSTGVTYDDNVFISHQNKQADEIFTVAGGFTFGLGDYRNLQQNYLLAQYLLTGFFFVHNSQEDAPNQELALKTQFRFSKLTLQTQTRYDYLTGVNRQVGNFVNQTLIDNLVRLNYDYSDKTQLFLSLEQITNLYQNFLSSYEYIGRIGGTYQITPKIRLGGEADFGELDQDQSPSSTYLQLRLLGDYELTGKLSLHFSAGEEIRHYDSSAGQTNATPVFSLGLTYHPFPDSSIALTSYRNVNASPSLAGENYVATGVALQLSQLMFRRITVGLSAGYENDAYRATESGTAQPGRDDNYFFIEPTLSYKFRDWLTANLSYEFRRNASNESSSTFSDNRITLTLGVNF